MKLPRAVLKVAAVGSSILLVAGFVSYRAGAFDWLAGPAPQPVEPEPAPIADATNQPADDPPPAVSPLTTPAILSSSKSAIIVSPPVGGQATGPAQSHPPIIGGTKSGGPIFPSASPPAPPASQAPNPPK